MSNYIGYGFDANDITSEGLYGFILAQAPDDAMSMVMDILEAEKPVEVLTDNQQEAVIAETENWVESEHCSSTAEYIVGVINGKTCPHLLQAFDNFIVFSPIAFLEDDNGRSSVIKSRQDLQKLITAYFQDEEITFGNIYDGVEWANPNYFLE